MKRDALISEARARVIWGEPACSVRSFLISKGFPATEAEARIEDWKDERKAELRNIGIRRMLIGGLLVLGAGTCLWLGTIVGSDHTDLFRGRAVGGSWAAGVFLGAFGLWKLVGGVALFFWPQSERSGIIELSE
jgi:hypothetical protein